MVVEPDMGSQFYIKYLLHIGLDVCFSVIYIMVFFTLVSLSCVNMGHWKQEWHELFPFNLRQIMPQPYLIIALHEMYTRQHKKY